MISHQQDLLEDEIIYIRKNDPYDLKPHEIDQICKIINEEFQNRPTTNGRPLLTESRSLLASLTRPTEVKKPRFVKEFYDMFK